MGAQFHPLVQHQHRNSGIKFVTPGQNTRGWIKNYSNNGKSTTKQPDSNIQSVGQEKLATGRQSAQWHLIPRMNIAGQHKNDIYLEKRRHVYFIKKPDVDTQISIPKSG